MEGSGICLNCLVCDIKYLNMNNFSKIFTSQLLRIFFSKLKYIYYLILKIFLCIQNIFSRYLVLCVCCNRVRPISPLLSTSLPALPLLLLTNRPQRDELKCHGRHPAAHPVLPNTQMGKNVTTSTKQRG